MFLLVALVFGKESFDLPSCVTTLVVGLVVGYQVCETTSSKSSTKLSRTQGSQQLLRPRLILFTISFPSKKATEQYFLVLLSCAVKQKHSDRLILFSNKSLKSSSVAIEIIATEQCFYLNSVSAILSKVVLTIEKDIKSRYLRPHLTSIDHGDKYL